MTAALWIENPPRKKRRKGRKARRSSTRRRRRGTSSRRTPPRGRGGRFTKRRRSGSTTRRRRRRARTTTGVTTVAKRRSSKRKGSPRRRRSRLPSTFGGGPSLRSVRGFTSPTMVKAVAGTAGGFVLAGELLNRLASRFPQHFAEGQNAKRTAAKAGIAVALGMIASRIAAARPMAGGLAAGAMASAALDLYKRVRPNALGGFVDTFAYPLNGFVAPPMLPSADVYGSPAAAFAGLGAAGDPWSGA